MMMILPRLITGRPHFVRAAIAAGARRKARTTRRDPVGARLLRSNPADYHWGDEQATGASCKQGLASLARRRGMWKSYTRPVVQVHFP